MHLNAVYLLVPSCAPLPCGIPYERQEKQQKTQSTKTEQKPQLKQQNLCFSLSLDLPSPLHPS